VFEHPLEVIINFTPTGMLPTKAMTPHVPISASEIVEDVHRAHEIGITMVHLHARDEQTGEPCWRAESYARIIEGIRIYAPELILCVSLSGRNAKTFQQRSDALRLEGNLKPDMGSLTLSSLNFNRQASVNEPDMIQALAKEMLDRGILPELEVFDVGMINYALYLEKKGLLAPPHYFNLILGNIACAQADPLHLGVMLRDLPRGTWWSVGGIGNSQLPMNMVSIASGGGVRVGLEDNVWFDVERKRLASNVEYLHRIHALIGLSGRKAMAPGVLRHHLNLNSGNGHYGRLAPSSPA
jgi:3-keto-5-aminohexanoate cleavage enzyme